MQAEMTILTSEKKPQSLKGLGFAYFLTPCQKRTVAEVFVHCGKCIISKMQLLSYWAKGRLSMTLKRSPSMDTVNCPP